MLPDDKKQLFKKLDELRNEVVGLKINLNQIDDTKEAAFQEKERISQEISKLIKDVQSAKQKRNNFTKEVKTFKVKRDELNNKVGVRIQGIKALDTERKNIAIKYSIKEDPSRIKEHIDELERKFETDVISFEKETQMMKLIKDLKKKYKEANVVSDVWEKLHALSQDVDILKRESHQVHQQIQEKARESQKQHEEMIALSKTIDELKVKEEDAYKKFFEEKKKFNDVNTQLKEKLMELNKISEEVNAMKTKTRQDRKKQEHDMLKSMDDVVQEKIKKGEKLTTEDLLVLQNAENIK